MLLGKFATTWSPSAPVLPSPCPPSLLSLVALTLSRPMIGGERAERFAWSWGHAQVIVALFAVLTMAVFKYYRATETWLTANSFLVSNAIVAAAVPFLLADMVLEAVIPW